MLQRIQDGVSVETALDEQIRQKYKTDGDATIRKRLKELGRILSSGIKGPEYHRVMKEYNELKTTLNKTPPS